MKKLAITSFLIGVSIALLLTGCGKPEEEASSDPQFVVEGEEGGKIYYSLSGYISAAFDVEVDGKTYDDMEHFYTKEIAALEKLMVKAGYTNHTLNLDADVGFEDLKKDMIVYVVAEASEGYAGETKVKSDGNFSVKFPESALDATYKVRANKRISVSITNNDDEEDVVYWCYNFSGRAEAFHFTKDSKPIIISTFESSHTKYACDEEEDDSLGIPELN